MILNKITQSQKEKKVHVLPNIWDIGNNTCIYVKKKKNLTFRYSTTYRKNNKKGYILIRA